MIADLATSADVAAVLGELRELRAEVAAMSARLPDQWLPLKVAADKEHGNCDPRTLLSAADRGEITIRRLGRKVLVLASSLRPRTDDEIARLAREARG